MRKFFNSLTAAALISFAAITIASAHAEDYLSIKTNLSSKSKSDEIKLLTDGGEFYQLKILIDGTEKIFNNNLIPTGRIKNQGGLEIFRGIGVADGNILIDLYFCSPSSSVCYDRRLIITLSNEKLFFTREEVVAFSGSMAARGVFYNKEAIPLESLSYQYFLENNDRASDLFTGKFGECIANINGDSVIAILDELEKAKPDDWISKKNCITPLLVLDLKNQGDLSEQAAQRYLKSLDIY